MLPDRSLPSALRRYDGVVIHAIHSSRHAEPVEANVMLSLSKHATGSRERGT
jgi:hypothetical protein